jgi:hypothetical protein
MFISIYNKFITFLKSLFINKKKEKVIELEATGYICASSSDCYQNHRKYFTEL